MSDAGAAPGQGDFFRATMRHFAEMRAAGPSGAESDQPFPADWFDLPPAFLADFGALFYLAGLTRYHRPRTLADLFAAFEPPLRLGQYKILRNNGYPRAAITWAGLGPDQERRFAVDHQTLRPEDWNSGPSPWLVDFLAPFGHVDQIVPHLAGNPDITHVRTLWHNRQGSKYRIVEWSRPRGETEVRVRSWGAGQFLNHLQEASHGYS